MAPGSKQTSGGLAGLWGDVSIYGLGTVLARMVGLVSTMVLTRLFTVDQFGQLELILTSLVVVTALASMYSESGLLRYYHPAEDGEKGRLLFTHLAGVATVGTVVAAAGMIVAGPVVRAWPALNLDQAAAFWAGPVVLSALLYNHTITCLRAARRVVGTVVFSLGVACLQLGLIFPLVLGLDMGLAGIFVARAVAESFGFLLVLLWRRRDYVARFSWHWLRTILRFSLPLVPDIFITLVLAQFSRYFLVAKAGTEALAHFGVAVRAAMVVGLLIGALKAAWLPYAFSLEEDEGAKERFAEVFGIYLRVTGCAILFMILFARELIVILASSKYLFAASLVGFTALAQVYQGAAYLLNTPLLVKKRTGLYLLASASGGVCVVASNLVLVPLFQTTGAAVAQVTGYLALDLILFLIGRRVLRVGYPIGYLLLLLAVVGGAALFWAKFVSDWSLWMRIGVALPLLAVAAWFLRREIDQVWLHLSARWARSAS